MNTNASCFRMRAVLYQRHESKLKAGQLSAIKIYSCTFSKSKINHSTMEKEGFTVLVAFRYFNTFQDSKPFTLFTDYQALMYILKLSGLSCLMDCRAPAF